MPLAHTFSLHQNYMHVLNILNQKSSPFLTQHSAYQCIIRSYLYTNGHRHNCRFLWSSIHKKKLLVIVASILPCNRYESSFLYHTTVSIQSKILVSDIIIVVYDVYFGCIEWLASFEVERRYHAHTTWCVATVYVHKLQNIDPANLNIF